MFTQVSQFGNWRPLKKPLHNNCYTLSLLSDHPSTFIFAFSVDIASRTSFNVSDGNHLCTYNGVVSTCLPFASILPRRQQVSPLRARTLSKNPVFTCSGENCRIGGTGSTLPLAGEDSLDSLSLADRAWRSRDVDVDVERVSEIESPRHCAKPFQIVDIVSSKVYRSKGVTLCHGFRLMMWDDYFWVNFDHFWSKRHFLRQLGQ